MSSHLLKTSIMYLARMGRGALHDEYSVVGASRGEEELQTVTSRYADNAARPLVVRFFERTDWKIQVQ